MRVPRDGRLLDDAHGAAFRLRVPGGRRAGAPHHRDALRRHRFHPRRQARHAASLRPPHRHDVLAQARHRVRSARGNVAVEDRGGGLLPHPRASGASHQLLRRVRGQLPHVLSAAAPEQVHRQRRLLDALGQGGVRLLHPARARVPRHAHLFGLLRERGGRPRGGREVPHRAHHGRRFHALPSLRALPDARHSLPVPRSVLHHQPRAGREARHRRGRLVLDRDAPRPHQDARQREPRARPARGVRAARLVVPRARRLGRSLEPLRLPRVERERSDVGRRRGLRPDGRQLGQPRPDVPRVQVHRAGSRLQARRCPVVPSRQCHRTGCAGHAARSEDGPSARAVRDARG